MKWYFGIFFIALFFMAGWADDLGVVKIIPDAKEHFVNPGDSLNVQCYVVVSSKTSLTWSKPTAMGVEVTERTEIKSDGKNDKMLSNVSIKSIKPEHLGEYKCSSGSSTATFKLLLTPKEEKETDDFHHGNKTGTLFCNITTVPALKIEKVEWLKNDTLISDLPDPKHFIEDPENRTLVIDMPTREDAGMYIARYTFKDLSSTYDCSVPYKATPFVKPFDKSKNLIEEDTLELRCRVLGYPRGEVSWMKDKKEFTMAERERIIMKPLDGYENATLIIKSVTFDDAGDYTCMAYSETLNASYSQTIVVRVKDKLAALWPFLGIVGEVVILCAIIFVYEKRRNKQAENEANNPQDVDGTTNDKKEGLRHRNTQSNNPTA